MDKSKFGYKRDSDCFYSRFDGYYCTECEELFYEHEANRERHSEYHTEIGAWEEWYSIHCPHCGSEEIDQVSACDCDEALMKPGESMCDACLESCREGWAKAVEVVAKQRGLRPLAARNMLSDYISYYEMDDFEKGAIK